mmetsp:Transcript_26316/g.54493  ORF Transcript_26316/g.54493 Transcript_26316/m.54493 type:complete len:376 (+) Transcript_26316:83-1210(+)
MFLTKRNRDDDDDSKVSLTNSTTSCSSDQDKDAVIAQMQSQLASHLEMINQLQSQLAHRDETISQLETQLVDMAMDLANSKAVQDEFMLKSNLTASYTSGITATSAATAATISTTSSATADKATNTALDTHDAATSTSSHQAVDDLDNPARGSQATVVLNRIQNARKGPYRRASVDPNYGQHLLNSTGLSRRSTDPENGRIHKNSRNARGCDDNDDDDDGESHMSHWSFPRVHKMHQHQHQHHDDNPHQGRNTYHGKSIERDKALEGRRKLAMSLNQLKWGGFKSFRIRHGSDAGNASVDSASSSDSEGRNRDRSSKDVHLNHDDAAAGDTSATAQDGNNHDRHTDTEAWKNQSSSSFMSTVVFPESFDDYLNDA